MPTPVGVPPPLPPSDPATATDFVTNPYNPFRGKGISKIIVSGPATNEQIYVASGDSSTGSSEVQELVFGGFPIAPPFPQGGPFTLTFTGDDQTGNQVSDTTGVLTYYAPNGGSYTDPNTGLIYFSYAAVAQEMQNALDALPNIGGAAYKPVAGVGGVGGIGGQVEVQYAGSSGTLDFYEVAFGTAPGFPTFGGTLSYSAPLPLVGIPTYPPNLQGIYTAQYPSMPAVGNPLKVVNGTVGAVNGSGAPGVWKLDDNTWSDLTGVTSANRGYLGPNGNGALLLPSSNTADIVYDSASASHYVPGFPNTPGPEDDYRMSFPQSNATWSDIQLAPNGYLYAALGNSQGPGPLQPFGPAGSPVPNEYQNAIFYNPAPTSDNPLWYIGDPFKNVTNGFLDDSAYSTSNGSNSITEFPTQWTDPIAETNGNIKFSAVLGGDLTPEGAPGFLTIYASVANPNGSLQNIWVSFDNGETWQDQNLNANDVTNPPNFLSNNGAYDNAIYAISSGIANVRPSIVYVGGSVDSYANGTGQVYVSTNASQNGMTWTDISVDGAGNGPHSSIHGFFTDPNVDQSGNTIPIPQANLLVATDGGIWELNTTNFDWTDLNGSTLLNAGLAIGQINGVADNPTDFTTAFGTTQNNGTVEFTNNPVGNQLNNNYYTSPNPQSSVDISGGGNIYVDPNNPLVIYEVETALYPQRASVRLSTDGGNSWTTLLDPYSTPYNIQSPNVPLVMDQVNPNRILVGGGMNFGLYESLDQGTTWANLAPPILVGGAQGVEEGGHFIALAQYQGNFAFDPSFPLVTDQGTNAYDPNTIYVTNGTQVYLTKNDGQSWVNRTPTNPVTGKPLTSNIVDIEVDPRDRDTVYVVQNVFGGSQIFESTNAGQTWTEIGASNYLPNVPAWKLVIDPRNGNLYVGTDIGVFTLPGGTTNAVSNGGTLTWERFGAGLPDVQIRDLVLNQSNNTLLAGSYGRSMYQIFLDAPHTATNPVAGALVGLAGSTLWTGPVIAIGNPANPVVFGADGNVNVPNNITVASLNIVGQISDYVANINPTIDKIGLGDVIFSGPNNYGGLTDIQQGGLIAANLSALGLITGATTVEIGAALELRSNLDSEPVTLNGNGFSFNDHYQGALRSLSGNDTFSGPITLKPGTNPDSVTVGADSGSEMTLTGTISGGDATFDLVKEGAGLVALDDVNSFTGLTAVYTGSLQLQNSGAIDNAIGAEVIDGGQLQLQAATGSSTPVSINAPLLLSGTGINGTGALVSTGDDNKNDPNVWAGAIQFVSLPNFAPFSTPTGSVALSANSGAILEIGGAISEPTSGLAAGEQFGLLAVAGPSGAGTVVLDNASTYSGQTEVMDGSLDIKNINSLGLRKGATASGTPAIQQITTLSSLGIGTFTITLGNQNKVLNWGASIATVTNDVIALLTTYTNGGTSPADFTVTVTRSQVQTTSQNGAVGAAPPTGFIYTITIVFTGALPAYPPGTNIVFNVAGSSTVTASGATVATGTVDTLVDNGAELQLQSGAGINVGTHILMLSGTGVNNDGALHNVGGNNTWSGPIIMLGSSSFGVDASSSMTITGALTSGFNLDKVDPGTLILLGGNTYSPPLTTIDDGALQVDRTITSNIVLNGGTLSGIGTVNGSITSTSPATGTGTINTSDNYPVEAIGANNTLTINGNVTLNNTDQLFIDLTDATSPISNLLNVTNGAVNLGGASLDGLVDPSVLIGDAFTIIKSDYATKPADVISGTFAGIAEAPLGDKDTSGYTDYATTHNFIDNGQIEVVVDYFPDEVTVTRKQIGDSMTLTLSTTAGSSVTVSYGQVETITATLTPTEPGSPIPTGNIVFSVSYNGGAAVNYSIAINASGQAVWDPVVELGTPLQLGTYTVNVSYNGGPTDAHGTPSYMPNSAGPVSVTVDPAASTTTLNATWSTSPAAPVYGQDVTFKATVVTALGGTLETGTLPPSGTVSFYDTTGGSNILLGTSAINTLTNIATFDTSSLASPLTAGLHTIEAIYNADGVPPNYSTSNSSINQTIAVDTTTITAFTSSLNPSTYGNTVTFTTTLTANSPGSGTPTGTLTFSDGSLVLATVSVSTSAGVTTATYTTTALQLPAGANQTITATYNGDPNFSGTAVTLNQTVNKATSSTSVSTLVNPADFGQPVTFTATVVSTGPGGGLPTGTVTFKDGLTILGLGTLSTTAGITTASFTTTPLQLAVGTFQTVTALYNGDSNFIFSSGTVSETVQQDKTTTTVSSSANPSVYGQKVTFTATVSANSPGSGSSSGTVTFMDGGTTLGTATLSPSGSVSVASFTTSAFQLSVGANQTITASYPGDGVDYLSSSGGLNQTVNRATTITAIASSVNPSIFGQSVTFSATLHVPGPGSGNPTGTVTFSDGGTVLGTGMLTTTAGVTSTSYTTSAFQLPVGASQTITATYSGDGNFSGSAFALTQTVNQDPTTTLLSSSVNPSVFGQPVTFTATVSASSPGSGNPTGTVTFTEGSVTLGTGTLSTNGSGVTIASYTTSASQLPSGVFQTITATYSGDSSYAFSFSFLSQSVSQDTTTTTVSSSSSTSVYGQQVTFTATVAIQSPGAGTPTGTVTFKDGSTILGLVSVSTTAGVTTASYTTMTTQLPVGTAQAITATYGGDKNDLLSSGTTVQNVNQASTATTISSSQVPSVYGQKVSFTATVSVTGLGSGNPTGVVTFIDGGTTLGTGSLKTTAGVTTASYTTTALQLPVGVNQTIIASYGGDTNYSVSAGSLKQTVNQDSTTTTVASLLTPSIYGQTVTFTATVSANGPGSGSPTGTVTFSDGSTTLGTGTLSVSGQVTIASFTTSATQLVAGNNQSITASYGGDFNFTSSSGTTTQSVSQDKTTTTLSSSTTTADYGQTVTFKATVSANSPGSGNPTGTVTFTEGGVTLGLATVSTVGGITIATLTTTQLPTAANETVSASYGGDSNFQSSATSANLTVNQDGTTTTLSSSANPSVFGQSVTFTATLAANQPGSGNPTGTVTFTEGTTTLGTASLSTLNGITTATLTTTQLSVGTSQSVTATYAGDTNFIGSSASVSQTVNVRGTKTSLVSSLNPSVSGQNVTLTAVVSDVGAGATTPAGTITFVIDGNTSGAVTVPLNGSGQAQLSTNALSMGSHTIVATYNPVTGFSGSTSNTVLQTVLVNSNLTVTSSEAPSVYGDTVSFTAKVVPVLQGFGVPTGSVTFTIDGGSSTTIGLDSTGQAVLSLDSLPIGANTIAVSYSGDGTFGSTSTTLAQNVLSGTTTTLSNSTPLSAVYGQQQTFTATVSPLSPGTGTPSGSVSFYVDGGSVPLATVPLNGASGNDQASISTNLLPVGNHTITAVYNGDANFATSTSDGINSSVEQVGTSLTLTTSAKPATVGQPVNFTATVTSGAPSTASPTGTVTFTIGGTSYTVNLTPTGPGVSLAVLQNTFEGKGTPTITASYSANTDFGPSSTSITETVLNASTTAIKSSLNPALPGSSVTFTATVKSALTGNGTPTGSVTFNIDGKLTTRPLSSLGVATLTLNTLTLGSHNVSVSYNGSSSFSSSSAALTQTVSNYTRTTLTTSHNPTPLGQTVTFTAKVFPVSSIGTRLSGIPGGTVTFYIGGVAQTPVSLVNGVATFSTSSLGLGKTAIKTVYNGDDPGNGYRRSTSATLTQIISTPFAKLKATVSAPSGLHPGDLFSLTLNALLSNGTLASSFTGSGSVTVISIPGGGAIFGLSPTITLTNGTVTISGLSVSQDGVYDLFFSVDGVSTELTIDTLRQT